MFIWRVLLRPALGRAAALRQHLLDETRPDAGTVIGARLFGNGPLFSVNRAVDALTAFDVVLGAWEPGPEVTKQLVAPPASELWEVPQPPAAAGALPMFTVRFTFAAAPATSQALLETVQRYVSTWGASAAPSQVWLRVSGGAPAIALVTGYPSLAAIEEARAVTLTDPPLQALAEQVATLTTGVQTPEIFEIVVAMP